MCCRWMTIWQKAQPRPRRSPGPYQGERQLLFGSMGRLSENSVLNVKNKSHAVTAELEVPAAGAEGVIIAQGGQYRRLGPLCEGRQAEILLQSARHAILLCRSRERAS